MVKVERTDDLWRQPRQHGRPGFGVERRGVPRPVDPDPTGNRAERRAAKKLGITAHARKPRKPGMAAYTPPGTGTETPAHMDANRGKGRRNDRWGERDDAAAVVVSGRPEAGPEPEELIADGHEGEVDPAQEWEDARDHDDYGDDE